MAGSGTWHRCYAFFFFFFLAGKKVEWINAPFHYSKYLILKLVYFPPVFDFFLLFFSLCYMYTRMLWLWIVNSDESCTLFQLAFVVGCCLPVVMSVLGVLGCCPFACAVWVVLLICSLLSIASLLLLPAFFFFFLYIFFMLLCVVLLWVERGRNTTFEKQYYCCQNVAAGDFLFIH